MLFLNLVRFQTDGQFPSAIGCQVVKCIWAKSLSLRKDFPGIEVLPQPDSVDRKTPLTLYPSKIVHKATFSEKDLEKE